MHSYVELGYALYRALVVNVLGLPLKFQWGVALDLNCCHGDTNFILQS